MTAADGRRAVEKAQPSRRPIQQQQHQSVAEGSCVHPCRGHVGPLPAFGSRRGFNNIIRSSES